MLAFFEADTIAKLTPRRVEEYWVWRRAHSIKTQADGLKATVGRKISDGTVIRELAGTLRPAIEHAINNKRLRPGRYYVPVPQAPRGRDYWITRSEAAKLVCALSRSPAWRKFRD